MHTPNWMLTNTAVRVGSGGHWRIHAARFFVAALEALLTWQARANERAHLAALDDRMLRDIGLSRADVAQECAKPFWRL